MRILASGKRDSVTGEEVVSVSQIVASSGRTRYSINSQVSGASEGALILGVSETTLNIPGKLGGGVVGEPSSERTKLVSPSLKRGKHNKVGGNRALKARTSTGGSRVPFSWKRRIEKGTEDFFTAFLSEYCCAWRESEQTDYFSKKEKDCGGSASARVPEGVNESKLDGEGGIKACESESCEGVAEEDSLSYLKPSNANTAVIVTPPSDDIGTTDVDVKPCNEDPFKPFAPGDTAIIKNMRAGIYHEKQVKSLCALHALNNLLQDAKAFKQEDLDKICSELDPNSWVNPHKSVFGLGNYDINVIMTALQQKKLEAIWFDKRKDPFEELNLDKIYGFILNIPSDCKLGWLSLPIKRKHWVAIRQFGTDYYNLDSKFDRPESIGSTDNLIEYLRGELKSAEKELFVIVTENVGETWRKNPPNPPTSETATGVISTMPPDNGNERRRDSGCDCDLDLLTNLKDINIVDLNKEDLLRRQSSGVWSDLT